MYLKLLNPADFARKNYHEFVLMDQNYCGWGETEVLMDVSFRRLALVQHRHLPAHGLLSFIRLLRAFRLNVVKRNQAHVKLFLNNENKL